MWDLHVLIIGLYLPSCCASRTPLVSQVAPKGPPTHVPGLPNKPLPCSELIRTAGGIRFELIQPPFKTQNTTYINIHSVPLPFKLIFSSYERVFTRLRQHYLVSTVLMGLLTGRPIREMPSVKLYSIQFGMLPKRRKTVRETWAVLTGKA